MELGEIGVAVVEDLSLGALLRWRRRLLGMTVADAARAAGWSKSSLSQVERGVQVARDGRLMELERALRMNPGDLVHRARLARAHEEVRAAARRGGRERDQEPSRAMGADVEFVGDVGAGWSNGAGVSDAGREVGSALCRASFVAVPGRSLRDAEGDLGRFVRWPVEVEPGAVVARVVGEAMRPAFEGGDLVVFGASEQAGTGVVSGGDYGVRLMPGVGDGWASGLVLARVYVDGGREEGARMGLRLQVLDGRVAPRVVSVGEVAELRRVVGFVRMTTTEGTEGTAE